jgi:hypothetical protein
LTKIFKIQSLCSDRGLEKGLKLLLEISVNFVQVCNVVLMSLLFTETLFLVTANHIFNFLLQSLVFRVKLLTCILILSDGCLHLVLATLSHEGFAHAVGNRGLVKSLVGLNGHTNFIADTHEEESALSTVNGDLANKFIEALGEKFFAGGVNSGLTGLSALKLLVKLILEVHNVNLVGRSRRDITDPELAILSVFAGRQDRVKVIFVTG